jgi:diketogulonate reductase-like aldo/keto reductase
MEHREFGRTQRKVAVIGQGTWYQNEDRRESAIRALRHGIELGLTHIDTAEMYLSGRAEEWVGEAIAGIRDQVFLVSKVLPHNASRQGTLAACESSLRRLRTGWLDCYLLHWPGHHPLAETIGAFQQLEREGKIRSWGVSNFDAVDLEAARRTGNHAGPVCNQVLYHLEERAIEHAVAPWCEKHRAALVAYSPFAHGAFPAPHTPAGRLLRQIADEHGATPRQVALRFLLREPHSFVIPKASDVSHLEENARAGDLELTAAEIERLNQTFPRGPVPRSLPML